MSKKNQQKATKKQKRLKWQMIWIISVAATVILAAALAFGIYAHNYNQRDHAQNMEQDELREYNYFLTVFGRQNNLIGSNDVLVLDTMSKELGGDSQITFHIYRYSSEADLEDALIMSSAQIAEDSRYEYMGNGNVVLIGNEITGMQNMQCTYIK